MCGRRTYGEGVADAVQFIARKAAEQSEKKAWHDDDDDDEDDDDCDSSVFA